MVQIYQITADLYNYTLVFRYIFVKKNIDMKTIIMKTIGDPSVLELSEQPVPQVGDNEVLVQVKALSINPVDVKTRAGSGAYSAVKDDHPIILGWDLAGTVTKKGKNVTSFDIDDQVFGMVNFPGHGRAYAEFVVVPEGHLTRKPEHVSFEDAAATTLAALTAYQALFIQGGIKPADKILIHAAAGGVGHFAVQLAKYAGAYVIATSSIENKDFVMSLGADEHIDYKGSDLDTKVSGITLCLDTIGGENIKRSLAVMDKGARIISIPSGKNEEVVALAKAAGVQGSVFKVKSSGADMNVLASLLEKGNLKPHVSHIFPFEQMQSAHEQLESGRTVGKVIVVI
jgi:NADPH:quinone reductase-like Zn-dependent oxidoreductase